MHRRPDSPTATAVAFGRAATGALQHLQRLVVLVGVFLFALALTSLAVSGGPANRTVELQFEHSDAVSH